MLRRRMSLSEVRWPNTQEFSALARNWSDHAISQMLGYVWQAYDQFLAADLNDTNLDAAQDDLERNITERLEIHIRDAMSGYEPFYIQHGPHERETRLPPPAQPPQYDIAFVIRANPRIMWPLEAKILHNDRDVAFYVADVQEQFLSCRYAPFSSGGAMVGYLLNGNPSIVFATISKNTRYRLKAHPDFSARPHQISTHVRTVPKGKKYPRKFACHHLVLALRATQQ